MINIIQGKSCDHGSYFNIHMYLQKLRKILKDYITWVYGATFKYISVSIKKSLK